MWNVLAQNTILDVKVLDQNLKGEFWGVETYPLSIPKHHLGIEGTKEK